MNSYMAASEEVSEEVDLVTETFKARRFRIRQELMMYLLGVSGEITDWYIDHGGTHSQLVVTVATNDGTGTEVSKHSYVEEEFFTREVNECGDVSEYWTGDKV